MDLIVEFYEFLAKFDEDDPVSHSELVVIGSEKALLWRELLDELEAENLISKHPKQAQSYVWVGGGD